MSIPPYTPPLEIQETEAAMEILTRLAELPPQAWISEHGLARIVRRHVTSVKRAIQRGELSPPVPLFNENVWTVAVLLEHVSARLEAERKTDPPGSDP